MPCFAVGLTNPSNLDLTVGDVTFQLFNGDSFLGTTVLPVSSRTGQSERRSEEHTSELQSQ